MKNLYFCFVLLLSTAALSADEPGLQELQVLQEQFDAEYFTIKGDFEKLRHVLLHLTMSTGYMAAYCESMEHGKIPNEEVLINEVLPDLLIHALQVANSFSVDLQEKYEERLAFIRKRAAR